VAPENADELVCSRCCRKKATDVFFSVMDAVGVYACSFHQDLLYFASSFPRPLSSLFSVIRLCFSSFHGHQSTQHTKKTLKEKVLAVTTPSRQTFFPAADQRPRTLEIKGIL
jgi:hypothetical protein